MPIQTTEPRRPYRQNADPLRGLIERGEYAVGSKLPPERDLALQLGVSRPSVREAPIALEVEGLVEVRMGSGICVRPLDTARTRRVRAEGPLEPLRARLLIEAELAAQAASHMKKRQVAGLRCAVALMQQEVDAGHTSAQAEAWFVARQPMGRFGSSDEIAALAVYLASDEAGVHDRHGASDRRRVVEPAGTACMSDSGMPMIRVRVCEPKRCSAAF